MGILWLGFGISGVFSLWAMLHTGHFWKVLFLTALEGVAAFFSVNFIGGFFGVHLPLNWAALGVSALGGTPAVIALLFLQTLFLFHP